MNILYYSHHHGSGHCRNAEYFHKVLGENMIVATSSDYSFTTNIKVVRLAPEYELTTDLYKGRELLPSFLHYSPIGNTNILKRSATLLNTSLDNAIDLAIIDLSVEVATLCRAASIPFAYVRLPGNRNDSAHLECFRAATFLLAYYPKELEDVSTPKWVVDKTIYTDFLIDKYIDHTKTYKFNSDKNIILVIKGYGGHREVDESIPLLRNKLKGHYVSVGPITEGLEGYYDEIIIHSNNVRGLMKHCDRIVIAPSLNLTSEALYSQKPVTVIPSERHFDEHKIMGKNLVKCGYADELTNIRDNFKKYTPTNRALKFMQMLKVSRNMKEFISKINKI